MYVFMYVCVYVCSCLLWVCICFCLFVFYTCLNWEEASLGKDSPLLIPLWLKRLMIRTFPLSEDCFYSEAQKWKQAESQGSFQSDAGHFWVILNGNKHLSCLCPPLKASFHTQGTYIHVLFSKDKTISGKKIQLWRQIPPLLLLLVF